MHPVKAYCERHRITQQAFAEKASLSPAFVSQVIRGVEKVGRESASKMVEASDGELTFDALMSWKPEAA